MNDDDERVRNRMAVVKDLLAAVIISLFIDLSMMCRLKRIGGSQW